MFGFKEKITAPAAIKAKVMLEEAGRRAIHVKAHGL